MAGFGEVSKLHDSDLVVLGTGAAGLTAALIAALHGLRPLVIDHAERIGGTSARSSGTLWIPGSHYLRNLGVRDDSERAASYLASLVGARGEKAMWATYLAQAPRMLEDLDRRLGMVFRPYMNAPDYRQDHVGAATGGRAIEPPAFDGRQLGRHFTRLEWPLRELMLFGGIMVTRGEASQLLRADRSPRAMALAIGLFARFLKDRPRYPRGTRLVLGNALIGRLLRETIARDVPVLTGVAPKRLIKRNGRIAAVAIRRDGRDEVVDAPAGVVLAGGGFPASAEWRARHLPAPVPRHTPAAEGCDGSTIELALAEGAALGPDGIDNALWFPSSIAARPDGSTAVYPHIVLDRAKPGLIAVGATGERFVNEAVSYHEFVRAMYRSNETGRTIPAFLVCDRAFIRRYGLGLIRPRTPSLRGFVASGYLHEARTLAELAGMAGIDPLALPATVKRYNGFVDSGVDADFGKGANIYDRSNGDPARRPNPCLGRIARPPFYALQVIPTPLGTSRALRADTRARVLDEGGAPIPGLYACGNDMQSAFGGEYPGAGAQLGQAMTFAWIAARHAAGIADSGDSPE